MRNFNLAHKTQYGAWEMKTSYQRNMLKAMAVTFGFVTVITFSFWLASQFIIKPDIAVIYEEHIIEISTEFNNKPIVRLDDYSPASSLRRIAQDLPRLAIPIPVPDEQLDDMDEMVIPDREQRHDLIDGQIGSGPPDDEIDDGIGQLGFGGTGQGTGERPNPNTFRDLQKYPEMISEYQPKYPVIARRLGMEGSVWLQVLIDTEGQVIEAGILKSSGIDMLDEAALEVAYKNLYSPGIQNYQAVMVWVKYEVKFVLSE